MVNSFENHVELRAVRREDLPVLFEIQCDPAACAVAAVNPRGMAEFEEHWHRVLADATICSRAIWADGQVVGSISSFLCDGEVNVGYWLARSHWGQGIATAALEQLLLTDRRRPVHARVAEHNAGSIRVLQKCGFRIVGRENSPATERFHECVEVRLILADAVG